MESASSNGLLGHWRVWSDDAESLLETPSPQTEGTLSAAENGIRLRRRVQDHQLAEGDAESLRRLMELLLRLQNAVVEHLRGTVFQPSTPAYTLIAERLERSLRADRAYVDRILGRPCSDPVAQALLLERFRGDLLWRDQVLHCLEGRDPPHPTYHARVALDAVMQLVEREPPVELRGVREERLTAALDVRRRLVHRRAADETSVSLAEKSPVELWRLRFVLSRLQAEVLAGRSPGPPELAERLGDFRRAAGEAAAEKLSLLSPERRRAAWDEVYLAGQENVVENAALIDSVLLPQAIALLHRAEEDWRTLSRALYNKRNAASAEPGTSEPAVARLFARQRRAAHNALQDKRLEERQIKLLGKRAFRFLENGMMLLIALITLLIVSEMFVERVHRLSPPVALFFALADFTICSLFLADFAFRLILVDDRWRYFRRNFIVDLLASLPFGFLAWVWTPADAAAAEGIQVVRLLRLLRLQIAQPFLRFGRLVLLGLRFTDRLMERYGAVFNRNIILWEPDPAEPEERRGHQALGALRDLHARRTAEIAALLSPGQRLDLAGRLLADLEIRLKQLPAIEAGSQSDSTAAVREIPVQEVVDLLITMTPERLNERMGPAFVDSIYRYVRMFDVPLVRRLPVIRELTSLRSRGPGEVAAAAANQLGRLVQALVDVGHYGADLQGTVSPPIFADRLGSTIVNATFGPAIRVLYLFVAFVAFYCVTLIVPIPEWLHERIVAVFKPLSGFMAILGAICFVPLVLGLWLRRIANQAADQCERIVEAQFAAQTKALKIGRRQMDSEFLAERVVRPELGLRSCDDTTPGDAKPVAMVLDRDALAGATGMRAEELGFLRNIELLYQDYLDGSPFHRSDTKTTNQLLGNLALANLRRSSLEHPRSERRRLQSLDLNVSSGLFGGPHLWFNYINRMLTQETAKLLLDYNRNALPLATLACSSASIRQAYQQWLSGRLGAAVPAASLPPPVGRFGGADVPADLPYTHDPKLLETVDFTALDFLTDDASREEEIANRFGGRVAELIRRDRREVVRKAFQSFPLHRIPKAQRTVNFVELYRRHVAGGRLFLIPFQLLVGTVKGIVATVRQARRVVKEILHPSLVEEVRGGQDAYPIAVRKIHRMRKPVFMRSLWLRARFDVEYLGLPLPDVPFVGASESSLEGDLNFIGASHFDRIEGERLRNERAERLRWLRLLLRELGLHFDGLRSLLPRDFPHLAERRAEVVRAVVAAAVVDHDDVATLGCAILGLRVVMEAGANVNHSLDQLPGDLPPASDPYGRHWRRPPRDWGRIWTWRRRLFSLPCFPMYELWQQKRIRQFLRRHRRVAQGWIDVVLSQGNADPLETLKQRLCAVIRRTDLWSDQLVSLRAIQTLTMLDVHHYCKMVWDLGEYEELRKDRFAAPLPHPRLDRREDEYVEEREATLTAIE